MTAPMLYVHFPGTTRSAMQFYADVFGGELQLFTLADFSRDDGPPDAIAHAELGGPVPLAASDAVGDDRPVHIEGAMIALLGTAPPARLHEWFDRLAEGGEVVDPLVRKPWGASDGQVIDRHGLRWLIGYEPDDQA